MAAKKDDTLTAEDLGLEMTVIVEEEAPQAEEPVAPKRRGRPPGTGKKSDGTAPKKTASRKNDDISDLAKHIQGLHVMVAMITGFGELQISDQESLMLAKGVSAVAEEYGLSLDGKTGAAMQLFGAAALIYVPRALMIKSRADAARKEREENGSDHFSA